MFLCSLQQDILQIVYVVLSERGIEAHRLEIENEEMAISRNACRSAKDMASWLNFIVNKADALLADTRDDEGTLVEKVKNVVIKGLDEKLSRKAIAERLQVNPDYLGKIFKREMGISINAYVQNERMKQARILLAKTDMPIYTIALEVGFDNFSHFSESFRKATGTCPGIYRKERTRVSIE
jgi:Transcriptional regulator containing an amidase domain and an AraC-type DNA-binding HTH domain